MSYNYDTLGNILSTPQWGSYTYDSRIPPDAETVPPQPYAVRSVGATKDATPTGTYEYDAAGNMTSASWEEGKTTFRYDALHQLVKVTLPNGVDCVYRYDAVGTLVGKRSEKNRTEKLMATRDYSRELNEATHVGTRILSVWMGNDNIAVIRNPGATRTIPITWILRDHLGNPIATLNRRGDLTALPEHAPFGEVDSGISADLSRGYTGHMEDVETGLVCMGARWYDPQIARFLTPDRVWADRKNPQSLNQYSYVLNNPISHVDPTGLAPMFFGFGIGVWFDLEDMSFGVGIGAGIGALDAFVGVGYSAQYGGVQAVAGVEGALGRAYGKVGSQYRGGTYGIVGGSIGFEAFGGKASVGGSLFHNFDSGETHWSLGASLKWGVGDKFSLGVQAGVAGGDGGMSASFGVTAEYGGAYANLGVDTNGSVSGGIGVQARGEYLSGSVGLSAAYSAFGSDLGAQGSHWSFGGTATLSPGTHWEGQRDEGGFRPFTMSGETSGSLYRFGNLSWSANQWTKESTVTVQFLAWKRNIVNGERGSLLWLYEKE
jgi:RHS repeat-associated protein